MPHDDIDAATLTKTLRGKWHGRYGLAYCPAHRNTRTPALSLANGEVRAASRVLHAGCDFPAIMDSLRELGLLNNDLIRTAPIEAELTWRRSRGKSQTEIRSARANLIWSKARPTKGTRRRLICEHAASLANCLTPSGFLLHAGTIPVRIIRRWSGL